MKKEILLESYLYNWTKEFWVLKLYLEFNFLLDSNIYTLFFTDQIFKNSQSAI